MRAGEAIAESSPNRSASVPALEVTGLTAGYGRSTVLRNVSLAVAPSTVTALLGPNGAGKTTMMRTIAGVLRPSSGTISLYGADVTGMSTHRRARAGLCHVPEGRGIFRSLTVRENLLLQAGGDSDSALDRAVEAFPLLGQRMSSPAHTLSGGQQQMLAMAAAYVRRPNLILVDEPSLGLAPVVVDEIFRFLETVTRRGAALLLVDQFIGRALRMATDAYVLRRGEIVSYSRAQDFDADDIFAHYVGGLKTPRQAGPG